MEGLLVNELDSNFKYDVASHPGGENIKACFACGACTGGCPASEIDPAYDPRKIIRMILLGMRERVLSSDLIWLCIMCYNCSFHCPQGVHFVTVMGVLREMAVKEGYIKPSFIKNIEEIDKLSQAIRHDMVMSIVGKKSEESSFNVKDLLKQAAEKI